MSQKLDLAALFPSNESVRRAFLRDAGNIARCPNGHVLPHRTPFGRCSPVDCCDHGEPGTIPYVPHSTSTEPTQHALQNASPYREEMDMLPLGLERVALTRDVKDAAEAERVKAQAEAALDMMRMIGLKAVRDAIHPMPELPPPPDLKKLGPRGYVKQRLEDVSPLMLERKVFRALYHPGQAGDDTAQELLDRAGHRSKEGQPDFRGSLVIVNLGQATPYDSQPVVDGQVVQPQIEAGEKKDE